MYPGSSCSEGRHPLERAGSELGEVKVLPLAAHLQPSPRYDLVQLAQREHAQLEVGAPLGAVGPAVDVDHVVDLLRLVPPALLPALHGLAARGILELAGLVAALGVSIVELPVGEVGVEEQGR